MNAPIATNVPHGYREPNDDAQQEREGRSDHDVLEHYTRSIRNFCDHENFEDIYDSKTAEIFRDAVRKIAVERDRLLERMSEIYG